MSFENLNAENRNHFLTNQIRRFQCCSFCRQQGHNITTCRISITNNISSYREFEVICATQVIMTNTKDEFKDWLIENYSQEQELLIGFSNHKFRYRFMDPVNAITEYIFHTYRSQTTIYNDDDFSMFLRNLGRREIEIFQELQEEEVRSMESMLLRDMFVSLASFLPSFINDNNKFNILLSVEDNEDNEDNKKHDKFKTCECSICFDEKEVKKFVKLGCNHEFCKDCIINTMKSIQANKSELCCPLCRSIVKNLITREESVNTELIEYIV